MDQAAREQFQELLKMLQQQMLGNQFQGLKQGIQSLKPEDMQRLREMVRDLNQMLQEKAQGGNPDFQGFMQKHGQFFPPGINSLEELVEHLQQQNAKMQSLMNSLTPEMRQELQQMMDSLLKDDRLEVGPDAAGRQPRADDADAPAPEPLPLPGRRVGLARRGDAANGRLQEMDQLERELRRAQTPDALQDVDADKVRELLGDKAAEQLEQLKQLAKILEDAGYIERRGEKYELTARAIRRIGQKALQDIFGKLKRDAFGKHELDRRGTGGERIDETKRYEYGDAFHLHLQETLMNSLVREGAGTPVRLQPEDFSVYRTQQMTQSSIVLMVDMSRSMILRGCFLAAKKVALALNSLIKGQYPNDKLYIVLFAEYAREVKPEALPELCLGRGRLRDELPARADARPPAPRPAQGREQAGDRRHRRRADGAPRGWRRPLQLPADGADHRRDAERGRALHEGPDHDQHVHARAESAAGRVRQPDDQDQQGPRLLRHAGEAGGVHAGRLRVEQAQAHRLAARRDSPLRRHSEAEGRGIRTLSVVHARKSKARRIPRFA